MYCDQGGRPVSVGTARMDVVLGKQYALDQQTVGVLLCVRSTRSVAEAADSWVKKTPPLDSVLGEQMYCEPTDAMCTVCRA